MSKVIVVGSSNIDYTVSVERLPRPGETVMARDVVQSFGGKGANQAVAAKRAGADVVFLTKLGADANGKLLERHFSAQGLPLTAILRDHKAASGVAFVWIDNKGNNQIAVVPGSNRLLTAEDVRRAATLMAGSRVLLVQMEIESATIHEALTLARRNRLMTVLNPAPARPLSSDLLSLVDVLTPNTAEVQVLAGQPHPEDAAKILVKRGAGSVIVTCGAEGALLVGRQDTRRCPAFVVDTIDSTGAGDAFNGALACALADGESMETAIEIGAAAGALATTKRGAQEAIPSRREIEELRRCGSRRLPS
ncbi:MAG: ribokinase [Nitrospiraceae bacterium]|nr:ribokinase [Nitrospiraceae bacterium]